MILDQTILEVKRNTKKEILTYNTGDSLVVTDPTTSPAVSSLSRGERTGSRVLYSEASRRVHMVTRHARGSHRSGVHDVTHAISRCNVRRQRLPRSEARSPLATRSSGSTGPERARNCYQTFHDKRAARRRGYFVSPVSSARGVVRRQSNRRRHPDW